jgi:hypothetical protein
MKREPSSTTNGLTRRSFMKTSVVAAIAAANLTIMSGLVDAQTAGPYDLPDADQASLNNCNIPIPIGCVTGICYGTNKHNGVLCVITCVDKKPVRCS